MNIIRRTYHVFWPDGCVVTFTWCFWEDKKCWYAL